MTDYSLAPRSVPTTNITSHYPVYRTTRSKVTSRLLPDTATLRTLAIPRAHFTSHSLHTPASGSRVHMELSRPQTWINSFLRHLCSKTALQIILTDSGTDDGILWNNLLTPLLPSDLVGWLVKHIYTRNFTIQKRAVRIIATL